MDVIEQSLYVFRCFFISAELITSLIRRATTLTASDWILPVAPAFPG